MQTQSIVMLVFGTRPEAIKMAPLYLALKKRPEIKPLIAVTAQHRHLLDQVLNFFGIVPDFDLDLMTPNQSLNEITCRVLCGMDEVFNKITPDLLLVHGDTTTTFAAAIAAYYRKIPVGHVEAGLRTFDIYSPFPEEVNRKLVGQIAALHFAPTNVASENLRMEGVSTKSIYVTGNTVIDALKIVLERKTEFKQLRQLFGDNPMILMTAHRRENFGRPFEVIFETVADWARANTLYQIVYPVHPNPNVKVLAERFLGGIGNIHLINAVGFEEMAFLIKNSRFILTDSGGLQEEAPTLGKPVLVLRETTERPEGVASGCTALVGHNRNKILTYLDQLKDEKSELYSAMSQVKNPYGDGTASSKIVDIVMQFFADYRC